MKGYLESGEYRVGDSRGVGDAGLILLGNIDSELMDVNQKDVKVLANDMKSFRAIVTTATGPVFYSWVFGFGGHVAIRAPEDVKEEYAHLVLEAAEAIKKAQ